MNATVVRAELALGEDYHPWLDELASVGPPPTVPRLPEPEEAAIVLARLEVPEDDLPEVVAALPSPGRDPAVWWLLERCYHRILRDIGHPDAALGLWPSLPPALGVLARCFWVYVFLAAVGDVRAWHQRRGIPDDVSWGTLADLGRHMRIHRQTHDCTGLDTQWWIRLHFRGGVYELGRLQFNPYRLCTGPGGPRFWYDADTIARLGPGFGPDDPALGVHVPDAGPLTPDACDASVRRAREFFARHYPTERFRIATCTSWLLDDQLAEYLRPEANILRFQRRFHLVPGAEGGDADVLRFVFKRRERSIDDLPQRTTLERAIVGHLRDGRHWQVRTGWFRLDG